MKAPLSQGRGDLGRPTRDSGWKRGGGTQHENNGNRQHGRLVEKYSESTILDSVLKLTPRSRENGKQVEIWLPWSSYKKTGICIDFTFNFWSIDRSDFSRTEVTFWIQFFDYVKPSVLRILRFGNRILDSGNSPKSRFGFEIRIRVCHFPRFGFEIRDSA